MSDQTYRVIVTREGDKWLADVPDLEGAHTYGSDLVSLDESVREVIALVEDLPDNAEADLELTYDLSAVPVRDLARAWEQVDEASRHIRSLGEQVRRYFVGPAPLSEFGMALTQLMRNADPSTWVQELLDDMGADRAAYNRWMWGQGPTPEEMVRLIEVLARWTYGPKGSEGDGGKMTA